MLTLSDAAVPAAEHAMAFVKEAIGAKSAAFYRVDQDLTLNNFLLNGVSLDFYNQYVAGMDRFDPLHARYANGRPVARLADEFSHPRSIEIATYQSFCSYFEITDCLEFFFRRDDQIFAGIHIAWSDARPIPENVMHLAETMHNYIEFNLARYLEPASGRDRLARYNLTPRECEILDLLCCGRTNRDIGECLQISLATVKTHLIHIFEKLGVETRAAAVALTFRRPT